MIFVYVDKVEKFNWSTVLRFMSTNWKTLAGELYCISYPRSGNI